MRSLDAAHLVASSQLEPASAYEAPRRLRVSPDFVVLDGLTLDADITVGSVPRVGPMPSLVADLSPQDWEHLLEQLLVLGYRIQLGPKANQDRVVFAGAEGPRSAATLHVRGHVEVEPGTDWSLPFLVSRSLHVGAGGRLRGSARCTARVEMEELACVDGSIATDDELVMHESAKIGLGVQARRLRSHTEGLTVALPTPSPAPPLAVPALAPAGPAPPTPPEPLVEFEESPVAEESTTFEASWPGAPMPGRYRIIAWADLQPSQVAPALRGHWDPEGDLFEIEVLEAVGRDVSLLAHPGTDRQRRIQVGTEELSSDDVVTTLLPILPRVTTMRLLYRDGVVMAAASVESLRWLITTFGKMLRLDSRLGRLREMRIFGSERVPQDVPSTTPARRTRRPSRSASMRSRRRRDGADRRRG